MSTQMIAKAKQYAESRKGEWKALAREAGVTYPWLCKFMQNQIPDPSYFRVERIYKLALTAGQKAKRSTRTNGH